MVGEKGPELINLARGAQVIPNHKIGDLRGGNSPSDSYIGSSGITARDLEKAFRKGTSGATIKVNGQTALLGIAGA